MQKLPIVLVFTLAACVTSGTDTASNPPADAGTIDTAPVADSIVTCQVSPTSGAADLYTTATVNGDQVDLIGAWNVPFPVPVGDVVPTVTALVRSAPPSCPTCFDSTAVNVMVVAYRGSMWEILAEETSGGDGSWQSLTLTTDHVATADEVLRIRYYTWSTPTASTRPVTLGQIDMACTGG